MKQCWQNKFNNSFTLACTLHTLAKHAAMEFFILIDVTTTQALCVCVSQHIEQTSGNECMQKKLKERWSEGKKRWQMKQCKRANGRKGFQKFIMLVRLHVRSNAFFNAQSARRNKERTTEKENTWFEKRKVRIEWNERREYSHIHDSFYFTFVTVILLWISISDLIFLQSSLMVCVWHHFSYSQWKYYTLQRK